MAVNASNGGVVEVRDSVMEAAGRSLAGVQMRQSWGNTLFPDITWQEDLFTIQIHVRR